MSLTEKQAIIVRIIQDLGAASVSDFKELEQSEAATAAHLNRLVLMKQVYISHWVVSGKHGVKPVFKLGNYPSMTRSEAAQQLNAQRRAEKEKAKQKLQPDHFDPANPRPDIAAQWLFNQPAVELLGARYD